MDRDKAEELMKEVRNLHEQASVRLTGFLTSKLDGRSEMEIALITTLFYRTMAASLIDALAKANCSYLEGMADAEQEAREHYGDQEGPGGKPQEV